MSNSEFTVTPEVQEDRTAAILSYITIIGFIVAIVLHSGKKTALGAFHLRQVLGFIIVGLVVGLGVGISAAILAFIPVIGPILIFLLWAVLWVGGLVLWLMGLIAAIQGKQTPVPLIGAPIQKWFANTFN
ncbi:MAG: hypothetical protein K0R17_1237 [Rariglobus sp.]|jgi:uncharacterized membrane protein|nr:hypothetical protein [Rariglobus sp.]